MSYILESGQTVRFGKVLHIENAGIVEANCEKTNNMRDPLTSTIFLHIQPKEPIIFCSWNCMRKTKQGTYDNVFDIPYNIPVLSPMDCFTSCHFDSDMSIDLKFSMNCLRLADVVFMKLCVNIWERFDFIDIEHIMPLLDHACQQISLSNITQGTVVLPEEIRKLNGKKILNSFFDNEELRNEFSEFIQHLESEVSFNSLRSFVQEFEKKERLKNLPFYFSLHQTIGPLPFKDEMQSTTIEYIWKIPQKVLLNKPTEITLTFLRSLTHSKKEKQGQSFEIFYNFPAYTTTILFAGPTQRKIVWEKNQTTAQEQVTAVFLTAGRVMLPEVVVHSKDDDISILKNTKYTLVGRPLNDQPDLDYAP